MRTLVGQRRSQRNCFAGLYMQFRPRPPARRRVRRACLCYTMFKGTMVLARSSDEIHDLVIAWVKRHGTIPPSPPGTGACCPDGGPAIHGSLQQLFSPAENLLHLQGRGRAVEVVRGRREVRDALG